MKNKGLWITLGIIVVIVLVLYGSFKGTYNQMVTLDEQVQAAWSQVVTDYQRRMDLIPNLVSTVKGYADFEQETLTQVIQARANATNVNLNVDNLDAATIGKLQQTQQALSSALSRLLVTVERYPDLKANTNFLELQAQLEGTENRIANARRKFNESTQTFNSYIRKFPQNIFANMFGFDKKPYFEADAGAEQAPKVAF
ncbi:MAG: LemA family protein [Bacteroidales bacterium]|jgi:LemA protein|nr:LemA family protein [Bacteroidales bacterium]NCU35618.1 LemA family protein [Candidatus Falkowbacteria bacterium]MDD2632751.1 LemA family protein [Bacteroidales bacterium]MDD3132418.1 LemA family protein [Bacteroidales bacterium]MDD3527442.1 LemA family protein [Bacteroidales bacterium]